MYAVRLIVCALLAHAWLFCQAQGLRPDAPTSAPMRVSAVNYDIRGVLDWPKKTFHGQMTLTWRNTGTVPAQGLPLRLCLNALKDAGGSCQISSVTSGGEGLAHAIGKDETIRWVRLPNAVPPGASIAIDVEWDAAFPKMQRGCGWAAGFLVAAKWYPKICGYKGDTWAVEPLDPCDSDSGGFGDYDVELSLPNALQLANTGMVVVPLDKSGRPATDAMGREVEAIPDPQRRLNFIYKIHAEDVRDFSWIATPNGNWRLARLDSGATQVFIYCIPKNGSQLKRLKDAIVSALRYAEQRLTPYPYPVLSVVDLPLVALGDGVSAPMLAAISNTAFDPFNQRFTPEQAAIAQLGDQLFKWTIAADGPGGQKFAQGLSNWFTDRVMESEYLCIMRGRRFSMDSRFRPWQARFVFSCLPFPWLPPMPNTPPESDRTASKPFAQLDALLGEDAMEDAVRSYLTGCSLGVDDFWTTHLAGTGALDYRIKAVSMGCNGMGAVTLERVGDVIVPITLRVLLKDGREALREWDGKDKVATLHFSGPILEAALDPMGRYPTLKGGLHTTWTAAPKRRGLLYWASMLSGAFCGLLQGMGIG